MYYVVHLQNFIKECFKFGCSSINCFFGVRLKKVEYFLTFWYFSKKVMGNLYEKY